MLLVIVVAPIVVEPIVVVVGVVVVVGSWESSIDEDEAGIRLLEPETALGLAFLRPKENMVVLLVGVAEPGDDCGQKALSAMIKGIDDDDDDDDDGGGATTHS